MSRILKQQRCPTNFFNRLAVADSTDSVEPCFSTLGDERFIMDGKAGSTADHAVDAAHRALKRLVQRRTLLDPRKFLLNPGIERMATVETGTAVALHNLLLICERCLVGLLDQFIAVAHVLTFHPASINASRVSYSPSNTSVS